MEQFANAVSFGADFAPASQWTTMVGADSDTSAAWTHIPYVPPQTSVANACIATTAAGKPCRGTKLPNREVCVGHSNTLIKRGLDPDTVTEWPL